MTERQALLARKVIQGHLVPLALQEVLVLKDQPGLLEQMEQRVLQEHLALQGQQAHKECKA